MPGIRSTNALFVTCAIIASAALVSGTANAASTERAPTVSVLSQPVQFVTVAGARLGYRTAGSGRPLVLIAGSSNTMAEWDPRMLDALAQNHRVVVFDNRGVGTSTGSVAHLTIALMARDTAQLIAKVTHGSADVLGWSMGGYIAQKLALHDPDRVRRLVLASTDCGGADTRPPTKRALAVLTDPGATLQQRLGILFPPSRTAAGSAWSTAVGAAYAQGGYQPANAFTVPGKTAEAQTRAAGPLWLRPGGGTCSHLGRISQRTLVGAGRDDVIVPIVNQQALLEGIPDVSGRTYRKAGHAFLFQRGLDFTQRVSEFLLAP